MKKLESFKGKLFEKEITNSKLKLIVGGHSLSQCYLTSVQTQTHDCGDKDPDAKSLSISSL